MTSDKDADDDEVDTCPLAFLLTCVWRLATVRFSTLFHRFLAPSLRRDIISTPFCGEGAIQ